MHDFSHYLKEIGEIGFVQQVSGSVVHVDGLPGAKHDELVIFENGAFGEVSSLLENVAEILIFSGEDIPVGSKVARTDKFLQVPVGKELLEHTINPLCKPLDTTTFVKSPTDLREVHTPALGIEKRSKIVTPLETGATIVDMLVPLGRGQRELIIGDRKTGKTSFIIQTMLTQTKQGTICIYAAIGKKLGDVKQIEKQLQKLDIFDKVCIVASSPDDPDGLIYLTPYTAMTIAEYFRDNGIDSIVIFDDLMTHAKFCREISLLAKRFPGRNSYPVDMFFLHSKLLERAGNFATKSGKPVSITALPVAEAIQGDLSGYIQTNLMSITDGHIYFDSDYFDKGRRPAINPFLSVTRVGRQTQTQLRREINRELTSFLTISEKMISFTHFGAELNIATKQILAMRDNLQVFMDQIHNEIMPHNMQIIVFILIWSNALTNLKPDELRHITTSLGTYYEKNKEFKKIIDDLVLQATSFNAFIHTVRTQSQSILAVVSPNSSSTPPIQTASIPKQSDQSTQVNQSIKPPVT